MKKLILSFAVSALLVAPAFAADDAAPSKAPAPAAPAAKAAKIIIVDTARVMDQATAARKAQDEIKAKKAEINASANKKDADLSAEFKALNEQQSKLSKEEFESKNRDFYKKVDVFKSSVNSQIGSVESAERKASEQINRAMEKVVMDIAAEQGADIVLPKGVVIIADKSMEFTPQVIERLNKALPSIKVEFKAADAAPAAAPAPKAKK